MSSRGRWAAGQKKLRNYLLEHVRYEAMMLRYSCQKAQQLGPGADRNAFIESFAQHARNLHEFLISSGADSRIRYAHDYVRRFRPKCDQEVLNDIQRKIGVFHQQIAHLGTDRQSVPEKKFGKMHAAKVMEWIEDTLQQFNTELRGTAYSDADWLPPRPELTVLLGPELGPSAEVHDSGDIALSTVGAIAATCGAA